jgi:hypothetical protein
VRRIVAESVQLARKTNDAARVSFTRIDEHELAFVRGELSAIDSRAGDACPQYGHVTDPNSITATERRQSSDSLTRRRLGVRQEPGTRRGRPLGSARSWGSPRFCPPPPTPAGVTSPPE